MTTLTLRHLAFLVFGVVCAVAYRTPDAQPAPKREATSSAPKSERPDPRFVRQALQENLSQSELARLAQSRARGADVKTLAERVLAEREALGKDLVTLAAAKGVTPPAEVDRATRTEERALAARKGLDFDRRYLIGALKALDREARLYRKAAKDSKDGDVRGFAAVHAPLIEQQLEAVRKVAGIAPAPPPTQKADEAPDPARQ